MKISPDITVELTPEGLRCTHSNGARMTITLGQLAAFVLQRFRAQLRGPM